MGLLCVLRRYADLIASSRPNGGGVFGDYVTNGCDGDPSFSYTKYVVDPQVQLTVVGYGASDGED